MRCCQYRQKVGYMSYINLNELAGGHSIQSISASGSTTFNHLTPLKLGICIISPGSLVRQVRQR